MVSVQDFRRMDLRVGRISEAERIAGTSRLLKVQVDLGTEMRTLVAGVAERYAPEELIGLQVVVLANMEPATIRGIRSQGMMLGAGCNDGNGIALLTVNKEVPNGTVIE